MVNALLKPGVAPASNERNPSTDWSASKVGAVDMMVKFRLKKIINIPNSYKAIKFYINSNLLSKAVKWKVKINWTININN